MMTDVRDRVFRLQEPGYELFLRNSSGSIGGDPNLLIPGSGIHASGWHVLDPQKPDGLNVEFVDFGGVNLDKTKEVGEFLATERDSGNTRLYFIWVSRPIVSEIRAGTAYTPLNFHLLYHPPTWESCYKRTPYWDGACPDWHPISNNEADVCTADMDRKPLYVRLGLRYGSNYSLAVPQHLVASRSREPRVIFVAPVSDFHDFSDLVNPATILVVLREIADFVTATLTEGRQGTYPGSLGKIMLSGYSRSGTRLVSVMNSLSAKDPFFTRHLSQINAFDINLGNNQAERETAFNPFWNQITKWKMGDGASTPVNHGARVCIYTAYRYHADYVIRNSRGSIGPATTLNLESPSWTDESLRKVRGSFRGQGLEGYNSDASVALVHLPVEFASQYLGRVANARGYHPVPAGNGHNWFLRALMNHAIIHADSSFFGRSR